jgi:hypothetical protein
LHAAIVIDRRRSTCYSAVAGAPSRLVSECGSVFSVYQPTS